MPRSKIGGIFNLETIGVQIVLPKFLAKAIDHMVGPRGRSAFFKEIAEREFQRRQLLAVLEHPGPLWKSGDHSELEGDSAAWVSRMRREDEAARQAKAAPKARKRSR